MNFVRRLLIHPLVYHNININAHTLALFELWLPNGNNMLYDSIQCIYWIALEMTWSIHVQQLIQGIHFVHTKMFHNFEKVVNCLVNSGHRTCIRMYTSKNIFKPRNAGTWQPPNLWSSRCSLRHLSKYFRVSITTCVYIPIQIYKYGEWTIPNLCE